MSFSKRTAEARGFSLIELMVAQVMVLVISGSIFIFIASMTKTYHTQEANTASRTSLRHATAVMLRDLQAIGGEHGAAGDLVTVTDGGSGASDQLELVKVNNAICPNLANIGPSNKRVSIGKVGSDCPWEVGNPACTKPMLVGRDLIVSGTAHSVKLRTTTVDNGGSCRIHFGNNTANVAAFNTRTGNKVCGGGACGNVQAVLAAIGTGAVSVASSYEYRVGAEGLERRVDGAPWQLAVPGVRDMQLAEAHDLNSDGVIAANEWAGRAGAPASRGALSVSGVAASAQTYFGAEVVLMTSNRVADRDPGPPPASLMNHTLTGLPSGHIFRTARVFAAARNRGAQ